MVSKVSSGAQVQYVVPAESSGSRPSYVRVRRAEDLDADRVEISSKKKDDGDKNILESACETVGKCVKASFDVIANAFAKAATDVAVDKITTAVFKK